MPERIDALELARKVLAEPDRHSRECHLLAFAFVKLRESHDGLVSTYGVLKDGAYIMAPPGAPRWSPGFPPSAN